MKFPSFLFLSLITGLSVSNIGYALGLGDIELKSHLNEALNARIVLSDVESAPDAACFTATDASEVGAFKKAYITLKKNNGVSQLNVITYDVITEPIVNLLIAFHCDPTISREYVLLMDPAPITNSPEIAAVNATTVQPLASAAPKPKRKTAKLQNMPASESAAASAEIIPEQPVKKKRKKRTLSTEAKLAEAYTGKVDTETETAQKSKVAKESQPPVTKANKDKPFLVISGGHETNSNNQQNLSLRMETQIDFGRTETAPLPTSTDDADEITVMANRLAHLEKQILSLQSKNIQLQTENEKINNESFRISPEISQWLQRILIGLGIIALLAVAELVRRKIMLNRLEQDEAVWFDAEANQKDFPDSKNISASIFNEPTLGSFDEIDHSSLGNSPFGNSFSANNQNATNAQSAVQNVNDEVENVLDHAEVFIEHGRPGLAIQLLQTHLEDAPSESPAVWLKLLQLLAKEGSEADYEISVKECNQFFNIKMPSFANAMAPDNSTLEDHPHIITRLEGVWGSQYAIGFLNDLIYNQQSQPREGFERNTFEDLFFLKQIATILQGNNSGVASAYKPEVIKPLLENVDINRTIFASEVTANTDIAHSEVAEDLYSGIKPEEFSSQSIMNDDQTRVARASADKYENRFADSDNLASDLTTVEEQLDIDGYDIDPVMNTEHTNEISTQQNTIDFEEINFEIPIQEMEAPLLPETTLSNDDEVKAKSPDTTAKTNFDLEESDADIISKYLIEAEEKTKNKTPKPEIVKNPDEDNVIEFDWDLPKVDKI